MVITKDAAPGKIDTGNFPCLTKWDVDSP